MSMIKEWKCKFQNTCKLFGIASIVVFYDDLEITTEQYKYGNRNSITD
jgi:hypothetical protein